MIKAIIFDYGNVIAHVDHSIFLKRVGATSSLPQTTVLSLASRQPELLISYESGRISSDEFYSGVVQSLKLSVPRQDFHAAFINIFSRIAPTLELIRNLKPKYRLGLLSNTNEWHYKAEIETVEVFPLFDAVTLSFEVGAMKPNEAIYRDALAKLNMQPHDCVYIDDIPEYVAAAQRLGMHAIRYSTAEALPEDLRKAGVDL